VNTVPGSAQKYFNEQALGETPSRNKYYFDAENEKKINLILKIHFKIFLFLLSKENILKKLTY
jgi:hypothetical protein